MLHPIKLIVGLGNPGPEYSSTRHNVGAWFVEYLARTNNLKFRTEKKFHGQIASLEINENSAWLFIPSTFMNLSGQAIGALCKFYKLAPQEILVAHDELDFEPGVIRLKQGGGSGGHNGLKDIVAHLPTADFFRLRIGIGHPGDRDKVTDYVLSSPSKADKKIIEDAIEDCSVYVPEIIQGQIENVMQKLHTKR